MREYLIAGAISGAAGLLLFLTIHHFWISPIWFILPVGLLIAAAGGAAVGWSYAVLAPSLPARPWTAFALVGLIGIILLPSILLGQLRPPLFDVSGAGATLAVPVSHAVRRFVFELLLTATIAGGIAGWWIGHSRQAMVSTAVAGFVFALGPGHNIPFLGNTSGAVKGIIILLAVVIVSAVVLVEARAYFSSRV